MPIVTRKRIKHLARYFGVLALLIYFGYYYTNSHYLLVLLGPIFFIAYWLKTQGVAFLAMLPNEPFFNNYFLLLPITIIYFGLVGFQFKNLINERGKIRLISILVFIAFLVYIHYLSFQELHLYWEGSARKTI